MSNSTARSVERGASWDVPHIGCGTLQAAAKGFSPEQAHAVTVTNHGLKESLKGELFDVVMVCICMGRLTCSRSCAECLQSSATMPSELMNAAMSEESAIL